MKGQCLCVSLCCTEVNENQGAAFKLTVFGWPQVLCTAGQRQWFPTTWCFFCMCVQVLGEMQVLFDTSTLQPGETEGPSDGLGLGGFFPDI